MKICLITLQRNALKLVSLLRKKAHFEIYVIFKIMIIKNTKVNLNKFLLISIQLDFDML